jgi:hypothetical protein
MVSIFIHADLVLGVRNLMDIAVLICHLNQFSLLPQLSFWSEVGEWKFWVFLKLSTFKSHDPCQEGDKNVFYSDRDVWRIF